MVSSAMELPPAMIRHHQRIRTHVGDAAMGTIRCSGLQQVVTANVAERVLDAFECNVRGETRGVQDAGEVATAPIPIPAYA